ncbi:helix-turn-helix domain-containing protein [Flammeovirga pacifica]|uniref:Helix-turn-helix domain-containing protein n=1 Tax=Flammeovirga pacifica TaxID=915059 RepID=A0A1S1Z0D3_FLAPC|nr:helix-turn-helix domain-containing protein [Flammeovirga pacifica]OHX66720.1 hypothetical protein NH26_10305 [Flammeovirga pacifica]
MNTELANPLDPFWKKIILLSQKVEELENEINQLKKIEDPDKQYTMGDVCQLMGLSRTTIYRYMNDENNPLPCNRVGRRTLFRYKELKKYFNL